jgi:shikimate dehydrogenase
VLHNAAYAALGLQGWTYERVECDAAGLPALVAGLAEDWVGLSVTMPGKVAALRVARRATERALAVGAANTLVRQQSGEWHADCTDVDGVVGALCAAGGYQPTAGALGVVLGAGSTACAALAGLAQLGVRASVVVAREPAKAHGVRGCATRIGLHCETIRWADADLDSLAERAAVLVNTTPAAAVQPVAGSLARAGCVLDVIYHPWPTALATAVQRRGGTIATGLDMLLHQAFPQVEQFTGRPAPRQAMRAALRAATGNVLDLPVEPRPGPDERIRAVTIGELEPFGVPVVVTDYNPEWPAWFAAEKARIHRALGQRALRIEHTGSTAVPGLAAKPVIDILLLVADPADEPAYVPALERAGYALRVREPDWYEHRMLQLRINRGADRDVNVHVFAPRSGAPEINRMLTFRDWLRTHDEDRDRYAAAKRDLARRDWKYVQHYSDAKSPIVEEILIRATRPRT